MNTTTFVVSPIIQKEAVTKYCFGICGDILLACIDFDEYRPWFPCIKSDCLYEMGRSEVLHIDGFICVN